jgi:DNA-binding CsgD family transcriptional regulator/sugar lactone lactonase YvrE
MASGTRIETPARLSPREMEVARMVAEGLTNREIAARLFLSERTVDGHLEHIREKLGVNTRAQVTAWVVRREGAPAPAPATPAAIARRQRWLFANARTWTAAAAVLALVVFGFGVLRLTAPPRPLVQTFAGSCAPGADPRDCGADGDNGPATQAKLSRPTSVAVDSSGVAYIADYANGRIREVERGVITTLIGGGDKELADGVLGVDVSSKSLGLASAVATDRQGDVYVLTSRNDLLEVWKIHKLLMQRVVVVGPSKAAASVVAAPNLPVGGLAITGDGVIYIADRAGNQIWRFGGHELTPYAGTGVDGFMGDLGNAIEAELSNPIGLALDKQENLYIADTGNDRIRRVDHVKETITTVADGARDGLRLPYGVAVSDGGTILIADTGNYRIRETSPGGTLASVAGTGKWGFHGDGQPATEAEFDVPEGIALTAAGDLFIADTENMRVRVIRHLLGS